MLRWTKLNIDFDADPNGPEPEEAVSGDTLTLTFFLNHFIHDDVVNGERGQLTFKDTLLHRLSVTNDEGFYRGQCRFSKTGIALGQFYELHDSDWRQDWPGGPYIHNPVLKQANDLRHFLFYFRDNTFECIARSYEFKRLPKENDELDERSAPPNFSDI